MTGYPSPPPPPGQPYGQYPAAMHYEKQWSALAIAAFILALLGFMGCTAVLAIALGIAGIVATTGGKRRGMGLAIAAIPIAIVTGSISVIFGVLAIRMFKEVAELPERIQPILAAQQPGSPGSVEALRALASASLDKSLSDEQIEAWAARVREKHGTLVRLDAVSAGNQRRGAADGEMSVDLNGQFVNGPATVRVVFRPEEMLEMKIDDLLVGGISLRETAAGSMPASPTPSGAP